MCNYVDLSNPPAPVRAALETIALRRLSIGTLQVQKSDRLDFHDVGVANLLVALHEAYLLGAASVPTFDTSPAPV